MANRSLSKAGVLIALKPGIESSQSKKGREMDGAGRGRSRSVSPPPRAGNVGRPRANSTGSTPAAPLAPLAPPPAIAPPPAVGSDTDRITVGTYLTHHGQAVDPAGIGGRGRAMSIRRLTDTELGDAANPAHPKGHSLTMQERAMAVRERQHRADALAIGGAIHTPAVLPHQSHQLQGAAPHAGHAHGSSAVLAPDAEMIRMGRFGQSVVDAAFRGNPGAGVPAIAAPTGKQMGVARSTGAGPNHYGVGVSGDPGGPMAAVNARIAADLAADSAAGAYPGAPPMTVLGAADPNPGLPSVPAIPGRSPGPGGIPPGRARVPGVPARPACAGLNAGFAANVQSVGGAPRVDPRVAAAAAPEAGTQGQMLYEAILNPDGAPTAGAGLPIGPALPPGMGPPVTLNSGLPRAADNYTTIARSHPNTVAAAQAEVAAPEPGTRPRSQSLSALTESCRNCLTGVGR